jgi:hypothetical protein
MIEIRRPEALACYAAGQAYQSDGSLKKLTDACAVP